MIYDAGGMDQEYPNRETEVCWIDLNHFAHEAGLDLVACLNILQRSDGVWDLRDSLHLVSFYNEMGRNVSWELGYGNSLSGRVT